MSNRGQNEQIKLYALIGLSIVAAVMAYFRFLHGGEVPSDAAAPDPESAAYEIPALPEWVATEKAVAAARFGPYQPPARDIFALAKVPEPAPPVAPAAPPAPEPAAPVVRKGPRLLATMSNDRGGLALIDDVLVRVGETVGDYRVVEIRQKEVVVESGKGRIVLRIGE